MRQKKYFPYRVYQEVRTKVAVSVVTPRYHLPPELITMINTLVYLESQVTAFTHARSGGHWLWGALTKGDTD